MHHISNIQCKLLNDDLNKIISGGLLVLTRAHSVCRDSSELKIKILNMKVTNLCANTFNYLKLSSTGTLAHGSLKCILKY